MLYLSHGVAHLSHWILHPWIIEASERDESMFFPQYRIGLSRKILL